ncbi:nucleotidyltransferase domain-containing protein [Candidatus Woesearchaeota archaeon]|nr:nucleotidyltransferase domain-containing protein [Candidatus Woesearchaeota archaeon]
MDNKLKIINYLGKHMHEKFTMHELSKIISIPYATFYRTVKNTSDIISKDKKGNTILICIKTSSASLSSYLAVSSEEEKKEFLEKNVLVKKIANELKTENIVLLFGSYAKGKQTEKSDIDLLIINKDGKKNFNFSKYELLFRKKINPICITKKEFKKMLNDKEENVGKQALKDHIILNDSEGFWRLVLNGI